MKIPRFFASLSEAYNLRAPKSLAEYSTRGNSPWARATLMPAPKPTPMINPARAEGDAPTGETQSWGPSTKDTGKTLSVGGSPSGRCEADVTPQSHTAL
ncbi:MAG: hypothetical protein RLZZ09_18 [Pseudomonadota bacterium]